MDRRRIISSLLFTLLFLTLGMFIHKTTVAINTSLSTATVYVDPHTSTETIGQNFMVNINISDVNDLYGWEFKLRWNSTLLDALNVTKGTFLEGGGDTFFTFKINNTEGYVLVDCTLRGDVAGVNGNGTLATIQFTVKAIGECTLDLYDTILVNSAELPIEHTVIDGRYYTSVHDVAVINLVASESSVNVTVENQGTCIETFNVSTYYTLLTGSLIGTQTITLEPGANTTLTFPWTPSTYGRYEIRAEASTVPGETDTADNICVIYINVGSDSGGGGAGGRPRHLLQ